MLQYNNSYSTDKARWLQEFLDKTDLVSIYRKALKTIAYRQTHPDWDRPVVMYGIRKKHKCIKKQEIGVIIDLSPWQDRTRTAETHWYKILYKRPATDLEWEEMKQNKLTRRYWIWSYFIEKSWTIDRIVSHIVQDDSEEYGLATQDLIDAFETYFKRKIRIYKREKVSQLKIFE
ncbi:hypothetical protein [Dysgonomonas sp. ZJ709]|uniref:hypothetical protein n=1 Tax=Dysgonomonas sp. ZJ709 TaxID=2709797 RepID=UPI0013EBD6D8|nr:hypothetical protein [Dysgonomonas sp. ZJ709]